MYVVTGKTQLIKGEDITSSNKMCYGKVNIIGKDGDAFKDLYDYDGKLTPGKNRFMGFQVAVFYFTNATYVQSIQNLSSVDSGNKSGFIPHEGRQYFMSAIEQIQSPTDKLVKLYREVNKNDETQLDNTEYIGSDYTVTGGDYTNLMQYISCIETFKMVANIDEAEVGTPIADYELKVRISDNGFNNLESSTGEPTTTKRPIPVIGKSIIGASFSNPGGGNFLYVFTPTVFDVEGNIVELKKEGE